jgi:hypothetical protein
VTSDQVVVVDVDIDDAGAPARIVSDTIYPMQKGDRATAYHTMFKSISDHLRQKAVCSVAIKASATNPGGTTMAHLSAAELRGVVAAGAADAGAVVHFVKKQTLSKTFGNRKVDAYVRDEEFWARSTVGLLRKASREACLIALAVSGGGRDGT